MPRPKTAKPEATPLTLDYGLYELACDVQNPHPDGRSSDWNKKAVWSKGTRFVVRHCKYYDCAEIKVVGGRYGCSFRDTEVESWNALVANCAPCARHDLRTVWATTDSHCDNHEWVLEKLIAMGKVSLFDVAQAIEWEDPTDKEE